VKAQGSGTVAHAGVVLPRLLADRVGLTGAFRGVLARAGFVPGRDRGRAVTDIVAALAAGASCLSDVEAMTAQVELFGPTGGASDTTVLRVLGEYADRLREDGCPGGLWLRRPRRSGPVPGRTSWPGTRTFPRSGSRARN
jgi:hypothetical protein